MRTHTTGPALAAAIVFLLFASVALGADSMDKLKTTTPEQRATVLDGIMKEKLALTAEQEPKIAAINLKYAEKMEPVIKGDLGMFSRMRQMREINGEKEIELQKALTADQWTKYEASKDEIRQKFDEKFAGQP
jgi:phage host-nuclease inhibitor protein Gam